MTECGMVHRFIDPDEPPRILRAAMGTVFGMVKAQSNGDGAGLCALSWASEHATGQHRMKNFVLCADNVETAELSHSNSHYVVQTTGATQTSAAGGRDHG